MTTAHRPTWHAAVGQKNEGGWQAGGAYRRSVSVGTVESASLVLTVPLIGAKPQANSRTSSPHVICLATPSSRPGTSPSIGCVSVAIHADEMYGLLVQPNRPGNG